MTCAFIAAPARQDGRRAGGGKGANSGLRWDSMSQHSLFRPTGCPYRTHRHDPPPTPPPLSQPPPPGPWRVDAYCDGHWIDWVVCCLGVTDMSDDSGHAWYVLETSLAMYPDHDFRVGMRSAMMDAAHLCDRIALEIRSGRRKSRARDAEIAIARRCADAIELMRTLVTVP
jgi:hypothetical protein